ncbi:hypothetical protein AB0I28_07360 [Phytomonospora sp. NPDC050363]|uniref:hypothetical protein n=1 Tax=Phytomonospora sp. NPDC050363 TaxID=3155642 RepID=UPI0033EC8D09
MAEYAPEAIRWLATQIVDQIPKAVLSGIVGDSAHTYGYHRARNKLPKTDYSRQLAEDKAGDGDAASALDVTFDTKGMKLVTGRLMASAKDAADPRLNVVREFYGTVDGKKVCGWDTYYNRSATSDPSHLWHVHISFRRKFATSKSAMADVLSVILGEESGSDVALTDADVAKIWRSDMIPAPDLALKDEPDNKYWTAANTIRSARDHAVRAATVAGNALKTAETVRAELDQAKAREAAILAAVTEVRTSLNGLSTTLVKQLAPQLVKALRAALADGLDEEQLTSAVDAAVRHVFGGLDDEPAKP